MPKGSFPKATCCRLSPPAWPWASRAAKSWALMATVRATNTSMNTLWAILPPFTSPSPHSLPSLVSNPWQEVRMSSNVGIFCSNNDRVQGNQCLSTRRSTTLKARPTYHRYPTFYEAANDEREDPLSLILYACCLFVIGRCITLIKHLFWGIKDKYKLFVSIMGWTKISPFSLVLCL